MEKHSHTILAEWLEMEGRKQKWLASVLGVTETAVSSWITKRKKPQPGHRARIEQLTGVPSDRWIDAK
jgi:predicted transcriptional regulator